ncbi:MAG: hypothetical protein E6559_19945 [Pantoea sp.]|nr:hypothetical protein [Pantoea sp.]
MKKRFILLALPLTFGTAMAFATPDRDAPEFNGPPPAPNGQPVLMPPPHSEPVYAVTQQTDNPGEAVKNIASQVPQIDAGKYTVHLEIIPLPPKAPGKAIPPKQEDGK